MNCQTAQRPVHLPLALAVSLALSACGGGGGGGTATPAASTTVEAQTSPTPGPVDAVASPPVTTSTAETTPAMEALAQQPAESAVVNDLDVSPEQSAQAKKLPGGSDMAPTVPSTTVQAPTTATAATATTTSARTYYIDSRIGSDTLDGSAPSAGGTGSGPWRSLAKLGSAGLLPGDRVLLVCGSNWNETLRVPVSGTAASPISIGAYPAGCSTPPKIDGATTVAAGAWALHQGTIYKTTLSAPALQIDATTGYMSKAHHPNRGFDIKRPGSLFLQAAANADQTTIGGRLVSTGIPVGADLVLPAGTNLAAGATVRVRTNAWTIDEAPIAAHGSGRISLGKPTSYPLLAGWGYYLMGQLWMLDSAGEWHYDAVTRTLYAWMPDGRMPDASVAITTLSTGIDLQSRQYISIDGLDVTHVGTGVNARSSVGITLSNSRIQQVAGIGFDGAGSNGAIVSRNSFNRTGLEAVDGIDLTLASAVGMQVTGNTITDSGVATSGTQVLSLPVPAYGAIVPGDQARVSGNSITGSAYHGIRTTGTGTIDRNLVANTCLVLDDCGGIYVYGAVKGSVIDRNTVRNIPGGLDGKPAGSTSQGQGIFLDDHANGVQVSNNTVTDAETGIFLHNSFANTVTGNVLYGNRKHQIWLFEDSKLVNTSGDVYSNLITGNQMFATSPSAAVGQLSTIGETSRFASYDSNRYSALISNRVVTESWPTGSNSFLFPDWQKSVSAAGVARLPDANGSVLNPVGFAAIRVLGASVVPNGDISAGARGWTPWNDRAPLAAAVGTTCPTGNCLEVAAGASNSLVASPPFSVVGGNWYRISFDMRSTLAGQPISLLVRRGGGGTNGYESLSGSAEMVNAPVGFQRYSFAFKATKTVNAADPVTKDIGARLYFDRIQPGSKLVLMNVEIVPISSATTTVQTSLLSNPTAAATALACPDLATNAARCSQYQNFATGTPLTWPLSLAAHASTVVFTRDTSLVDNDGDGIADIQDKCPATPKGQITNAAGCGI